MLRGAVGLTASETYVHVGFLRDASVVQRVHRDCNERARAFPTDGAVTRSSYGGSSGESG